MSELSKQALKVENNTQFPNNNSGYITPSRLRGFNTDMIDSTVNQNQYELDSGSWNSKINSLEAFTGSIDNNFVSETEFGAYTSSNDTKVNNLSVSSSLQQAEIDSLIAFTGSVTTIATGSLLVTASAALNVITFTKGDNSTFNVTVGADTTALNAFTASQEQKDATLASVTSSLNQFTASANSRLNNLESFTASLDVTYVTQTELATATGSLIDSIATKLNTSSFNTYTSSNDAKWTSLQSQSGSWITETESGSFLITASVSLNTITFTKGNNTQFSLTVNTGSSGGDITSLNAFTASQQLLNATFATTGSNTFRGNQTLSGSIVISGSTLNVISASANGNVITNLGDTYTDLAPVQTIVTISSASYAALVTSSTYNPNTLYIISGAIQDTTDLTPLNQFTASQAQKNLTLASYTGSNDAKWSNLGAQSGSFVTESETGSFARYDVSNPWSADQTFTNITAVSASFQYVKTVFETASVIFSSGSNQFGDASNDIQTLYGSVRVMNQLTASGLNYPTADNGAKSFMQTDGAGNLSLQYVDTIWETIYAGESVSKGTPLYISGSQGSNPIVYAADASDPNKMPVTYVAGANYTINNTYPATVLGLIEGIDLSGYTVGDVIYVAEGGGWTTNLPSGSNSITQVLGVVTKAGNGGKGLVLNPGPAALPGLQTGYIWVGNGNNRAAAVATSSIIPLPTDITSLNEFTASADSRLNNLEGATGSYAISSSVAAVDEAQQLQIDALIVATGSYATTGSNTFYGGQTVIGAPITTDPTSGIEVDYIQPLPIGGVGYVTIASDLDITGNLTASLQEGYVWVGDSTGKTVLVSTSSFGTGGTIDTASFATTGSNTFTGVQNIVSASFSGSLISNLTDIYTDIPPVDRIVTLTSASYAALVTGSLLDTNTLYLVSGSTTSGGGTIDTGSLMVTGSVAGNVLTFTKGDATTFSLTVDTGSGGGGGADITSLNEFTASQELLNTTFATTGSNIFYGSQSIWDSSATYVETLAIDAGNVWFNIGGIKVRIEKGLLIPGDQDQIVFVNDANADYNTIVQNVDNVGLRFAPSVATDATMELFGYSLNVANTFTASISEGKVWVGDSLGRTYEVATSSFAAGDTGSFMITGSVFGDTLTFTKGDGSTFSLTVSTGGASGSAFPYTGSAVITGSLEISGSARGNVVPLSISSNTASINFDSGNYFTLTLAASATTHIAATNIKPGTSATLLITSNTGSVVVFAPNILEPSGSFYTPSLSGSKDVISFVSFDSNNIYAVSTKNMI